MTFEQKQAAPALNFECWKAQLRKDCELVGKLLAFDNLGEYTLKLFWEYGLPPTLRAIVGSRDGHDYKGRPC